MLRWTLGYTCLFPFWFPQCVCPAVGLLDHKAGLFFLDIDRMIGIKEKYRWANTHTHFKRRKNNKRQNLHEVKTYYESSVIKVMWYSRRQKENRAAEDEIVGWHRWLSGQDCWETGLRVGPSSGSALVSPPARGRPFNSEVPHVPYLVFTCPSMSCEESHRPPLTSWSKCRYKLVLNS